VWRFDGASWTQTQAFTSQLYATLQAADALGSCGAFAVGGQTRIGHIAPFAARLDTTAYGYGTVRLPSHQDLAPGSLVAMTPPLVGATLNVAVDDPTQALGVPNALVLWAVAAAPAPGFPAGLLVPFGGRNGGPGELFVDPATIGISPLAPWAGGPVTIGLPIPNQPTLVGADVYTQAALLDLATGLRVVFTNGLDLHLGH
jgi:hypothetical protein